MIGIVVVSHSHALATAALTLASEMVPAEGGPKIALAAGLDEKTFGTDAARVADALAEADSPDGVLVLLDLGSALLSAEMALEFVEPELAERVVLSSAPLVEGLVAAAASAATGADLSTVRREAESALRAKSDHLGQSVDGAAAGEDRTTGDGVSGGDTGSAGSAPELAERTVVLTDPAGMHARPAGLVVAAAARFDARVVLVAQSGQEGDAASILGLLGLGARHGERVVVRASGAQAVEAVEAVAAVLEAGPAD
ncbi:PTS hybrid protein [Austwickia chelonae]|uniref:phosphoenolpyruvate--glycerone phosphotransferase n=1 Tax=Austwickia chelonae NBRC 105200 TaxID=1184607 RepID=K6WBF3_9MICO|nr:dihydroxyacetone kinase phosphoryl donor subunit DhaM [Austwickia chelonae]GAB79162.1 dihydroxyacetone kinase phosphotransferase subunit DhaM [Austwickia chelonae NBRC 105200]SEW42826.1 PTS hybrid protein [Austwickia chelonae]